MTIHSKRHSVAKKGANVDSAERFRRGLRQLAFFGSILLSTNSNTSRFFSRTRSPTLRTGNALFGFGDPGLTDRSRGRSRRTLARRGVADTASARKQLPDTGGFQTHGMQAGFFFAVVRPE